MSADVLRRAATLMRERAGDATPGPWSLDGPWWYDDPAPGLHDSTYVLTAGEERTPVAVMPPITEQRVTSFRRDRDAAHIASWHPAVALAVADWLEAAWTEWEREESSLSAQSVRAMSGGKNEPDHRAVAVARTYLNEQETP